MASRGNRPAAQAVRHACKANGKQLEKHAAEGRPARGVQKTMKQNLSPGSRIS
jgi:hypothetical protein